MNEFLSGLKEGLINTPLLEWLAVLTGVLYVILAARKSIWCWVMAFISSGIFVILCYEANLYVESILQIFYVIMAVVGWWMWKSKTDDVKFVIIWPLKYHLLNIVLSLLVAILLGYYLDVKTDQANPYVDSFTTIFSLAATFMVTKKVLNNWIYWIIIDLVSIYLYASRGLELSAVLYFIFTVLAVYGWLEWRKQFKLQET